MMSRLFVAVIACLASVVAGAGEGISCAGRGWLKSEDETPMRRVEPEACGGDAPGRLLGSKAGRRRAIVGTAAAQRFRFAHRTQMWIGWPSNASAASPTTSETVGCGWT